MSHEKQYENKNNQEVNLKLEEIEKLGKVIFHTKEGKIFLKHLVDIFLIDNCVSPYNLDERYACFREGQNDMVRMLLKMGVDVYDK